MFDLKGMLVFKKKYAPLVIIIVIFVNIPICNYAQKILNKKISIHVTNKKTGEVLKSVGDQSGFEFSYNSNILNEDSLISINIHNQTVKSFLNILFGNQFKYEESNSHLIILPATSHKYKYIEGFVKDNLTGEPIANASVYEPQQLIGTMTNNEGYFRLQLKDLYPLSIRISKVSYSDTTFTYSGSSSSPIFIPISPIRFELDTVVITPFVESSFLIKNILSARQRLSSLNLGDFIANQPYQFSLTPGLGSHGKIGAQVINKFSLNVIGGYTAGVNGLELGSIFNIVKNDVRYVQVGGLFNLVGGSAEGVQVGGIYNQVLKNFRGVQVSGIIGITKDKLEGIQIAGIHNYALDLKGIQVGGIGSYSRERLKGLQISGIFNYTDEGKGLQISSISNIANKRIKGLQISGILNYTQKLDGVQIGLVNISDSSQGYAIGLVNIVKNGYQKISLSSNEVTQLNVSFKSGNRKLYSVLPIGINFYPQKAYSIGYGLGRETPLNNVFSWNAELTSHWLYLGNWNQHNLLFKLENLFNFHLTEFFSIATGPSINVHYSKPLGSTEGYKYHMGNNLPSFNLSKKLYGYIGWTLAINLF